MAYNKNLNVAGLQENESWKIKILELIERYGNMKEMSSLSLKSANKREKSSYNAASYVITQTKENLGSLMQLLENVISVEKITLQKKNDIIENTRYVLVSYEDLQHLIDEAQRILYYEVSVAFSIDGYINALHLFEQQVIPIYNGLTAEEMGKSLRLSPNDCAARINILICQLSAKLSEVILTLKLLLKNFKPALSGRKSLQDSLNSDVKAVEKEPGQTNTVCTSTAAQTVTATTGIDVEKWPSGVAVRFQPSEDRQYVGIMKDEQSMTATHLILPIICFKNEDFVVALIRDTEKDLNQLTLEMNDYLGDDFSSEYFCPLPCTITQTIDSCLKCTNPDQGFEFVASGSFSHSIQQIIKHSIPSLGLCKLKSDVPRKNVTLEFELRESGKPLRSSDCFQYCWDTGTETDTEYPHESITLSVAPEGRLFEVGGCKVVFPPGSFPGVQSVTVKTEIDNRKWPSNLQVISPTLSMFAENLQKVILLELETWCSVEEGKEEIHVMRRNEENSNWEFHESIKSGITQALRFQSHKQGQYLAARPPGKTSPVNVQPIIYSQTKSFMIALVGDVEANKDALSNDVKSSFDSDFTSKHFSPLQCEPNQMIDCSIKVVNPDRGFNFKESGPFSYKISDVLGTGRQFKWCRLQSHESKTDITIRFQLQDGGKPLGNADCFLHSWQPERRMVGKEEVETICDVFYTEIVKRFANIGEFFQFARVSYGFCIDETKLQEINEDFNMSSKEKKYQTFLHWKAREGEDATPERLRQLVEKYFEKENISSSPKGFSSPEDTGEDTTSERLPQLGEEYFERQKNISSSPKGFSSPEDTGTGAGRRHDLKNKKDHVQTLSLKEAYDEVLRLFCGREDEWAAFVTSDQGLNLAQSQVMNRNGPTEITHSDGYKHLRKWAQIVGKDATASKLLELANNFVKRCKK